MRRLPAGHEEATIRSFVRDPDLAAAYLEEVLSDGDMDEVRRAKRRVEEARARRARAPERAGREVDGQSVSVGAL